MARRGYQNIITTYLVDDPMLTDHNIKTFKKELYDFALVRHDYPSASIRWRVAVITHSQKKIEKLKAVVSGHQELATNEKRISEELTKNCYLPRGLDKLKQEWT
jgi:hypothetical protein